MYCTTKLCILIILNNFVFASFSLQYTIFEMCNEFGFNILNGTTRGDEEGEFTFLSKNGASVIDLALARGIWTEIVEKFEAIESNKDKENKYKSSRISISKNRQTMDFFIGGCAAMCAGFFSNPFDVIKTRQQLQGELQKNTKTKLPYKGIWQSVKSIVKSEGLLGLQKGLGPALSFQFVMNSTRLGLYATADRLNWTKMSKSDEHSTILCIFWGGVSGVIGSSISCPLYMIKTQIQAQSYGQFAVGFQHDHRGTIDALKTVFHERGFKGLWRGYSGIVPRTAVGSSVQLASFSSLKDNLLKYEIFQNSVFLTAFSASMVSGFITVVFMAPFDVVATRLFNQGVDSNGRGILYRNIIDCFVKTFKYEGIKGLYKGFIPNYWRIAPHTILNLTFWEQFKKWKDLYLSDDLNVYFE